MWEGRLFVDHGVQEAELVLDLYLPAFARECEDGVITQPEKEIPNASQVPYGVDSPEIEAYFDSDYDVTENRTGIVYFDDEIEPDVEPGVEFDIEENN